MPYPLRGAKFRPNAAQATVLEAEVGTIVELRPEPTNAYDPHAVAIYLNSEHIGYWPREATAEVHDAIESGSAVDAVIVAINGLMPELVMRIDEEPVEDFDEDDEDDGDDE